MGKHFTTRCRRGTQSQFFSFLRGRDGNVAVEFAFAAPIMVVIMWACVDYGQLVEEKIRLTNAVAAGVQYASQSSANAQDAAGIQSTVRSAAMDGKGSIAVSASLSCSCEDGTTITCGTGSCLSGLPILEAMVSASESFAVSIPTPLLGPTIPLSSSATMRVVR